MRDVGDTRQDFEELDSAINSGLYLKDAMNRQNEDFYYIHIEVGVVHPVHQDVVPAFGVDGGGGQDIQYGGGARLQFGQVGLFLGSRKACST